jgi:ubiquinone/menaquinone biosynthesis C-methylase UbiE
MPTEREVYQSHADQYERLIQCEDHRGNLLRAIEKIITLHGLDVVELGAGTGRLTRLLAPHVRSIHAFDTSAHMLLEADRSLRAMGSTNWATGVADHRHVPVESASADVVLSGWSFCYLAVWGGVDWLSALQNGMDEIKRILRPGGTVLLIESLGTGFEQPTPPKHLEAYLDWLAKAGFESDWIRTDYRFESLEQAVELSTFFFGQEISKDILRKNWIVLPECTGLWWRHF